MCLIGTLKKWTKEANFDRDYFAICRTQFIVINYRIAIYGKVCTVWKLREFLLTHFWKTFRERHDFTI